MQLLDMHCHVLPGIDDGANSMKMSCKMLHMFQRQGGQAVIATPHSSMKFSSTPEEIRNLCGKAEKRFYGLSGYAMRIYPGQEIFYRDSVIKELEEGKLLTLADSAYVLVEFLPETAYSVIAKAARQFAGSGYWMILAHAERYSCIRKEKYLDELLHLGVYIQINARTVGGNWYDSSTRWCRKVLKERKAHFISSDMHNTRERKPEFSRALEWMQKNLKETYTEEICWKNTRKLIDNQKI